MKYILLSIIILIFIAFYYNIEHFTFDYDYQLKPIRFKDKCKNIGLIDEYFGGESDAYKDRYIPYILNFGFYELNRDY
jgi:hypothetical protein